MSDSRSVNWPVTTTVGPGLHGALAGPSDVGSRDGGTGDVQYRGRPVEQLTARHTFEEVAWLLIGGYLPTADDEDWTVFRSALRDARDLPDDVADLVCAPLEFSPLRLLRAGMSALGSRAPEGDHSVSPAQAGTILGQCAGLIMAMALHRRRMRLEASGESPGEAPGIPSDTALDTGLILALGAGSGERIQQMMQVLGTSMILVADDSLEPATFAGMVVASCDSDPYSAVVATLSGIDGVYRRPVDARQLPDVRFEMLRRLAGDDDAIQDSPLDARLDDMARDGLLHAETPARPGLLALTAGLLLLNGLDDPPMAAAVLALPRLAAMLARMREYMPRISLFRPFARYVGPDGPRALLPIADREADSGVGR